MPDPISITPRRVLVACYSLSGHTRRVALELARHCRADIETLTDRGPRQGVLGTLRCGFEALLHLRPWLRPSRCAPADYDLVIVCTPVWAGNMASPVRSWLRRHRTELRRVALVCTYGSAGHGPVLHDMQQLCGLMPVARLALSAEQVTQRKHARRLREFGNRVMDSLPLQAGGAPSHRAA